MVGRDPAAPAWAAAGAPAVPGQEARIGEDIDVLFILIKTGKFLSVVTAEQLCGCVDKTAHWGRIATIKAFESTMIVSALSKIL